MKSNILRANRSHATTDALIRTPIGRKLISAATDLAVAMAVGVDTNNECDEGSENRGELHVFFWSFLGVLLGI